MGGDVGVEWCVVIDGGEDGIGYGAIFKGEVFGWDFWGVLC